MPRAAPSPCRKIGCRAVVPSPGGFCPTHRAARQALQDERRGSAASRGYGSRWRKAREVFLAKHPLCVECEKEGLVVAGDVVDHIIPHRGDSEKFWDSFGNWQVLCFKHHNIKTAREDGGFGKS